MPEAGTTPGSVFIPRSRKGLREVLTALPRHPKRAKVLIEYRGYDVEVYREECLCGDVCTFTAITRLSDLYVAHDGTGDGTADTVRFMVKYLLDRIDKELASKNPWGENDDD